MEDKPTDNSNWLRVAQIAKYEQPPPGFHEALRGKIQSRIEQIEMERAQPWWHRFVKPITGRPALVWANVVTFVGLGFVGLSFYEAAKNPPLPGSRKTDLHVAESGFDLGAPISSPARAGSQLQMMTQMVLIPVHFSYSSAPGSLQPATAEATNPIPFGLFQVPSSQSYPASFRIGSGN